MANDLWNWSFYKCRMPFQTLDGKAISKDDSGKMLSIIEDEAEKNGVLWYERDEKPFASVEDLLDTADLVGYFEEHLDGYSVLELAGFDGGKVGLADLWNVAEVIAPFMQDGGFIEFVYDCPDFLKLSFFGKRAHLYKGDIVYDDMPIDWGPVRGRQ
jgi:hypothetical protein